MRLSDAVAQSPKAAAHRTTRDGDRIVAVYFWTDGHTQPMVISGTTPPALIQLVAPTCVCGDDHNFTGGPKLIWELAQKDDWEPTFLV